jgi:hypothetical protein
MHSPREVLLEECSNLRRVLDETLQANYGFEGSEDFYTECQARLNFIKSELDATPDSDHPNLQKNASLLGELSNLLSRIERSSIEQYSWPFVEELKRIALVLCAEATLLGPDTQPLVFVLSEGGLASYRITHELRRPSGASRLIHTITLPRTLKHFVLLHSILGHEIGHAMSHSSKHQGALQKVTKNIMLPGSPLESLTAATTWMYSATAPVAIRQQLAAVQARHGLKGADIWRLCSLDSWSEEILCDFLGVLTFGPSFVAAETNILLATDPSGCVLGTAHPPVSCRIDYLLSAAKLLGHSTRTLVDAGLNQSFASFWAKLESKRQSDPWFTLFTDQKILDIAAAMTAILTPLPPALYKPPEEQRLLLFTRQLANHIPPVASYVTESKSIVCEKADFRDILEAGWISASAPSPLTFFQLNRLCELGILQQKAVDITLNP